MYSGKINSRKPKTNTWPSIKTKYANNDIWFTGKERRSTWNKKTDRTKKYPVIKYEI
jgi:hypothetical protein